MPMHAVIVLAGENPQMHPLNERTPAALIPVVGRPFVVHVVETLVERGFLHFDVLLCHRPERFEALLGNGARWGCSFRYHLVRDPVRPYRHLRTLRHDPDWGHSLLVHGDRLLLEDLGGSRPEAPEAGNILFCTETEGSTDAAGTAGWTGWAWATAAGLRGCPPDVDESGLAGFLSSGAQGACVRVPVEKPLSVQSFDDLLETDRRILDHPGEGRLLDGRETEPGIWMARHVRVHPLARLVPPVYIGENCRVGLGVRLGPHAVVGDGCVLDRRCTVQNALILPGSYVGEALELADVIVDRNRLVNVRFGVAVTVADDFILGSLGERRIEKRLMSFASRVAAALLLVVACPALLLTALVLKLRGRTPVLGRQEAVCLPAPEDPVLWRTFHRWSFNDDGCTAESAAGGHGSGVEGRQGPEDLFLRFLPALLNIARGEMRFVGVRPRTREEVASLPPDWRSLYLASKPGVVTEAFAVYGSHPSADQRYSAEAFYCVACGFVHDLRLLVRYLRRVLTGTRR